MTVDEIKTALNKAGLEVEDEARLPNNTDKTIEASALFS
jgi:beta-lactam-binding protein with PASTA domain